MVTNDWSSEAMLNLALLDPPKWGWSAFGGITNVCSPHEMAKRKEARERYLERQKKVKLEKEQTTNNDSKMKLVKETKKDETTTTHSILPEQQQGTIIETTAAAVVVVGKESILLQPLDETNDSQPDKATTTPTTNESKDYNTQSITKDDNNTTNNNKASLITTSQNGNNLDGTKKDETLPSNDVVMKDETQSSKKMNTNNRKDNNEIQVEGGVLKEIKESDGKIKKVIHLHPTTQTMDIYSYHRGRAGLEPRDKTDGMLLDCETWSPNDTHFDWDKPNLQLKVKIEFPLVDDDDDDDDDEQTLESEEEELSSSENDPSNTAQSSNNDTDHSTSVNSRTRLQQQSMSEKGTAYGKQAAHHNNKSDQKKKRNVPMFSDTIEWDLSDPETQTPMIFAANIAEEYGLSFCQTLELASSIQSQIDTHCRNNIPYCVPISRIDPVTNQTRDPSLLQPPDISSIPNTLYGGHMASSISSTAKPLVLASENQSSDGNAGGTNKTPHGKLKGSGAASSARRRTGTGGGVVTRRPKTHGGQAVEVVPKHLLPTHDGVAPVRNSITGRAYVRHNVTFNTEKEYRNEVLRRAKEEFKIEIEAGRNLCGEVTDPNEKKFLLKFGTNCVCHICHARKDNCAIFACKYYAHNYCDFHTATRLGFNATECKGGNFTLDFCPICCLTCVCPKCARRLDSVSVDFKKQCLAQGKSLNELKDVEMKVLAACIGKPNPFLTPIANPNKTSASSKRKKTIRRTKVNPKPVIEEQEQVSTPNSSLHSHGTRSRGKSSTNNDTVVSPVLPSEDTKPSVSNKKEKKPRGRAQVQEKCTQPNRKVVKVSASEFPIESMVGVDVDPSEEDDYLKIFTPDGSKLCEKAVAEFKKKEAEELAQISEEGESSTAIVPSENTSGPLEDGNVDYCLICNKSGGLVCCDRCPRAFHPKCISTKENELLETMTKWECQSCKKEREGHFDECEKITGEASKNMIIAAFQSFGSCTDFESKINFLSKIYDTIQFLIKWDFGYVFENPLDVEQLPGYLDLVQRPMDLGTISTKMTEGKYCEQVQQSMEQNSKNSDMSALDESILLVLKDIETVWQNCLTYNQEGSSVYRMAGIQRSKCQKILFHNVREEVSPTVRQKYAQFVEQCRRYRLKVLQKPNKKSKHVSKHRITVPKNRSGNSKAIAVFDPDTNMIIKQYTTIRAAVQAAFFLQNLGYESEFDLRIDHVKKCIREGNSNPSKTMFCYRWMFVHDLKSGNFKVQENISEGDNEIANDGKNLGNLVIANDSTIDLAKELFPSKSSNEPTNSDKSLEQDITMNPEQIRSDKTIIYKMDSISNKILDSFETVDQAYADWKKARENLMKETDHGETKADFVTFYVDGNSHLDGIAWKRTTSLSPDETLSEIKQDENGKQIRNVESEVSKNTGLVSKKIGQDDLKKSLAIQETEAMKESLDKMLSPDDTMIEMKNNQNAVKDGEVKPVVTKKRPHETTPNSQSDPSPAPKRQALNHETDDPLL